MSSLSKLREEFPDGERHCWDWFSTYSLAVSLVYLVSFSILIVNALTKICLTKITKYYGYQSKPEKVNATTRNIFLLTFINSGVVIHLVYFSEYDGFS